MRRYYNIRVRSDAPGEFQTGEMCELNIEGVIFVQFIGMKRLDYQLSLILTPRVAGNLRDSLTNKLLRRSVRRSADNTGECPILCVRGFGLQVVRESVGVSHG